MDLAYRRGRSKTRRDRGGERQGKREREGDREEMAKRKRSNERKKYYVINLLVGSVHVYIREAEGYRE